MSSNVLQLFDDAGKPIESVLTLRASRVPIDAEGVLLVHASVRRAVETMHEMCGVGIAWPQIGISSRAFVSCSSGKRGDERVFVNPDYFSPSGASREAASHEGCLSVNRGSTHRLVPRFREIVFTAYELLDWWKAPSRSAGRGARFHYTEFRAVGLEAFVLQHETDHLDGILLGGLLNTPSHGAPHA